MKPLKKLPSLNALKAFEAVSRHLNFKLAADELHVTQSAVAQQVRSLEDELSMKLFDRHSKGVSLTPNGRNYANSIQLAFNLIHEATSSFINKKQNITISVTPTFAAKWLIPRLANFMAIYPEIELQILATEKISHFQNDSVDLAIRYGHIPSGSGLNIELLVQDSFIAVASPDLVKLKQGYIQLEELFEYTLLHDAQNLWSLFLEQGDAKTAHKAFKNLRFNQTALAIDAAISGQGIMLTNPLFIDKELKNGKLIKIFEQELNLETGFYLVSPHYPKNTEDLLKIRNWLISQFRST